MSQAQIVIKHMMLGSYFARIKPYLKNNRRTNKLVLKRPPFFLFFQVRKNLRGFFFHLTLNLISAKRRESALCLESQIW